MTRPAARPSQALVPAGADPAALSFAQMLRRADVLAKSELVPTALQGKPEAIMVLGVWGAEHGISLMTAIQEVHVIEKRPSPSAQLRLALIRRAGHEVRFIETTDTEATIRGRRREYRDDPNGWITVTYTIDQARKAGLLDRWVMHWVDTPKGKSYPQTYSLGNDATMFDLADAPAWVHDEIKAGRVKSKDNWAKYPAEMLRARAASALCRMEFSDVLAAFDAHPHTAEELGLDVGQDIDEPAEVGDDDVTDAELVEDEEPPAPAGGAGGEEGDTPATALVGPPPPPERPDVVAVKARLNALTPKGRHDMRVWMAAQKPPIPDSIDATEKQVAAVNAELDRRAAS